MQALSDSSTGSGRPIRLSGSAPQLLEEHGYSPRVSRATVACRASNCYRRRCGTIALPGNGLSASARNHGPRSLDLPKEEVEGGRAGSELLSPFEISAFDA